APARPDRTERARRARPPTAPSPRWLAAGRPGSESDERSRVVAHDNLAGPGEAHQPGGHPCRLPRGCVVRAEISADDPHDDGARVDSHADPELHLVPTAHRLAERLESLLDRVGCAERATR